MKRLRWSQTGDASKDRLLDTLVSLWLEGVLDAQAVYEELAQAVSRQPDGFGMYCPEESRDLAACVRAAQIFAHWEVFLTAVDYCDRNVLVGQQQRRAALDRFSRGLHMSSNAADRRWLVEILDQPPTTERYRPLQEEITKWLAGETDTLATRSRLPAPADLATADDKALGDAPLEDQFERRLETIQVSIRNRMFASLLNYCDSLRIPPQHRRSLLDHFRTLLRTAPLQPGLTR
jgi:hypothetical protein